MTPYLQEILHSITLRITALEQAKNQDRMISIKNGEISYVTKEWVGLTDEEIQDALFCANLPTNFSYRMAGKAIEAKLKEKNL